MGLWWTRGGVLEARCFTMRAASAHPIKLGLVNDPIRHPITLAAARGGGRAARGPAGDCAAAKVDVTDSDAAVEDAGEITEAREGERRPWKGGRCGGDHGSTRR